MSEAPPHNDPSSEWPQEIKEAYEHLKVPSLYDALLANEKMSLEIRRQNRDIKSLYEGIQTLSTQLNSILEAVSEEWEEYEEYEEGEGGLSNDYQDNPLIDFEIELTHDKQSHLRKIALEALMDTHDTMLELSKSSKQINHQLRTILPDAESFFSRPPAWYSIVEQIIQSYVEKIEFSRFQLLSRLEDMHIEIVNPQPGETYNEDFHLVIDHLTGGTSSTIAYVIRIGYRQSNRMLRPAEVVIYK